MVGSKLVCRPETEHTPTRDTTDELLSVFTVLEFMPPVTIEIDDNTHVSLHLKHIAHLKNYGVKSPYVCLYMPTKLSSIGCYCSSLSTAVVPNFD